MYGRAIATIERYSRSTNALYNDGIGMRLERNSKTGNAIVSVAATWLRRKRTLGRRRVMVACSSRAQRVREETHNNELLPTRPLSRTRTREVWGRDRIQLKKLLKYFHGWGKRYDPIKGIIQYFMAITCTVTSASQLCNLYGTLTYDIISPYKPTVNDNGLSLSPGPSCQDVSGKTPV